MTAPAIDNERSIVKIFVAFSVTVHLLLLCLAYIFREQLFPPIPLSFSPAQTRVLTDSELKRIQERAAAARQVVQSADAPTVENPSDTAPFLGTRTQRVKKQTRSTEFGTPHAPPPTAQRRVKPDHSKSSRPLTPTLESLMNLHTEESKPLEAQTSTGLTRGSYDKLPQEVSVGTQTLLNTDEYIYASFLNRLSEGVAARWRALLAQAQVAYAKMAEGRYQTSLLVTLSDVGAVESVDVVESSGQTWLDEAGRSAFFQELEFKNPPKGLQDSDGKFRFNYGFELTLTRQARVQFGTVPDARLLPSGAFAQ